MEKKQEYSEPLLSFSLGCDWVSHELSRFLGALNYLNNVFVLHDKLKNNTSYRLQRSQTRVHIYRNAHLYFYLDRKEELKIHKIHISSPGTLEFVLQNSNHAVMITAIILFLSRAPNIIEKWLTMWKKFKSALREERRNGMIEKIEKKTNEFFTETILPKLKQDDIEISTSAIHNLHKAVINFSKQKLADPISAMDQILHSMVVIAHLKNTGKFNILKTDNKDG